MRFYDWSGGMESSAMLVVELERIRHEGAIVRWADTGKHFPEMYTSKAQIEAILGITIVTVPRRISFDEFLLDRGGMIRKGTTDCSRRMKRSNLARHMKTFSRPYEVNLGYNADELQRRDDFMGRNEREWLHWRFPLIEYGIDRDETVAICRKQGFTILCEMYEKMGRLDCYFCGNQRPAQAELVVIHYPQLADDWQRLEEKKGHSFMPISIAEISSGIAPEKRLLLENLPACSCFGGADNFTQEEFEFDGIPQ